MKRLSLSILILTILLPLIPLHAQTWKTKIQRVSGSERTKTLRLKPGISVSVGSLLLDNDSLKEAKYYDGKFHSGSRESITLKLNSVKSEQSFTNGIKFRSEKPVQLLALEPGLDSGLYSIPLRDVHYLNYRDELAGWVEIGEPVILLSILTMIASPLISYNFKEGKLNAETYKKWGIGGTIGILSGISAVIVIGTVASNGKYHFKADWPYKRVKVWKFK